MDTICNLTRNTTKRVKLLAMDLVQVGEKNWLEGVCSTRMKSKACAKPR